MRIALAAVILLIACLVAAGSAQSAGRFQSVSGEFGKTWISSFQAAQPKAAQENKSGDLWSWGSAPRGSMIVDGQLVADPQYIWPKLNYTYSWLGDANVDPKTGVPIHTFVDPRSGKLVYAYEDPYTGKTVYTYTNPNPGNPVFTSELPFYTLNGESDGSVLPPVFNTASSNPWA